MSSPRPPWPPTQTRARTCSGPCAPRRTCFRTRSWTSPICRDYLGEYGGWVPMAKEYGKTGGKWIALPQFSGNYINYRISSVESQFKQVPDNTDAFLELMEGAQIAGARPAASRRCLGDGNAWAHWLLWAFGGTLTDPDGRITINSPETRKSLEYCKALYATFAPGTVSWNDSFNNKAFLAGEVHLTNNGISIYAAAQERRRRQQQGGADRQDMDHAQYYPIGPIGNDRESTVLVSGVPSRSIRMRSRPSWPTGWRPSSMANGWRVRRAT
ncbi:MAG: extracellular solute-binding protein [Burkholderiaceae bacterium]